jgi:hypothetical protein
MTATTAPAGLFDLPTAQTVETLQWHAKGFTDDVTTCEHCGRVDLKGTVRMVAVDQDGAADGEEYMGVICAARMTGRKAGDIRTEAVRADRAADAAIRDAHRAWSDAHTAWKVTQRVTALGADARPHANLQFFSTHRQQAVTAPPPARPPQPRGAPMTDTDQTVKLHVEVHVDYTDDDYDTGVTVAEWNAMSPSERGTVQAEAWQTAVQYDDGGIWPVTPGATNQ